jgi:hypothetical protein
MILTLDDSVLKEFFGDGTIATVYH